MRLSYEAEFLPSPRPLTPRRRLGTSAAGSPPLVLALCALALGSLLLPSPAARAQEAAPELEWTRILGGDDYQFAGEIASDGSGGVYVAGSFEEGLDLDQDGDYELTSRGDYNRFVARYTPQGALLWFRHFEDESRDGGDNPTSDGDPFVFVGFHPRDGEDGATVYCNALAKYAPNGDRLWLRFLSNPAAAACGAHAFDSDVGPDGSTFVTGYVYPEADFDGDGVADVVRGDVGVSFVARYDGDGAFQWVRRVDGADVTSVVVAPDGLYVAGSVDEEGADFDGDGDVDVVAEHNDDIFFAKYTEEGALEWVRGVGGQQLSVNALAAGDGGLYATGSFYDSVDFDGDGEDEVTAQGDADGFVVKYDAEGALAWAAQQGSDYRDGWTEIEAVDGGVLVAGGGEVRINYSERYRSLVSRYTSAGERVWTLTAGGEGHSSFSSLVPGTGGFYLAGSFGGTLDLDADGDVEGATVRDTDAFVARFLTDAENAPPQAVDDAALVPVGTAVDVPVLANDTDPEGGPLTLLNVIEGGRYGEATVVGDAVRYVPEGRFYGRDRFTYAVTDEGGRVSEADVAVTLGSANGAPLALEDGAWLRYVNAEARSRGRPPEIAAHDDGVYLTGRFIGSVDLDNDGADDLVAPQDTASLVASYDRAGTLVWSTAIGAAAEVEVAASGPGGTVYVAGGFEGELDFDGDGTVDAATGGYDNEGFFIAQLGAGGVTWSAFAEAEASYSSSGDVRVRDIATDADGAVYVVGWFWELIDFNGEAAGGRLNTYAYSEVFVAKFDADGELAWAVQTEGMPNESISRGGAIAVGDDGVTVTGSFTKTVRFGEAGAVTNPGVYGDPGGEFVARIRDGAFAWVRAMPQPDDLYIADAVADGGTTYVAGGFTGDLDLDGDGQAELSSAGSYDAFVAAYGADGDVLWARRSASGDGDDGARRIGLYGGDLYVAGTGEGGADFDGNDGDELLLAGPFLARYATDGAFVEVQPARHVALPTPADGRVYASGSLDEATADVDGDGDPDVVGTGLYVVGLEPPSASVPLPVELAGLEAVLDGGAVRLSWRTLSERDASAFVVERRSGAQAPWVEVGRVEAAGDVGRAYAWRDDAPPPGADRLAYRLRQVDRDGTTTYSPEVLVERAVPRRLTLYRNYPNPFNPTTTIRYDLPAAQRVRLAVYDVLGREVAVLVDGMETAGRKRVVFEAANLPSGTYLYRLEAGSFTQVQRMLLLK